ncbi:hypothetical protein SAMN06265379_102272 [Saccharicrinis carchari]|uniref:Uncharacterized protein n=1 Tax=Saccharicrinis carchari TaxID=1168039 RepID=A0A521C067_SACCC|nr:hypothetical protein [Saccharicrinis carchari]SMO52856.1 hypothetical protein SAMN06265379_102272 [Saccharicrinis carchari]
MILTTPIETAYLTGTVKGDTVINPGETLSYTIHLNFRKTVKLLHIKWSYPNVLVSETDSMEIGEIFEEGLDYDTQIQLLSKDETEGFGKVEFSFALATMDDEVTIEKVQILISVFKKTLADVSEMSEYLQERYLWWANDNLHHANILLADGLRCMEDFMHIEFPPELKEILSADLEFNAMGHPVDYEDYRAIILKKKELYSIKDVVFYRDNYCNESNDKFDISAAQETKIEEG